MKKGDAWLYLLGGILAIIFGIIHFYVTGTGTWIPWILFIVGLIVGFLAIQEKEYMPMIWATLFIVILSWIGAGYFVEGIGVIGAILTAFIYVYVPAGVVILMKYPFIKK